MVQSFSLNGSWEMQYSQKPYCSQENPWTDGCLISNAVPGYWEDMEEAFAKVHFAEEFVINPEYQKQEYPMSGYVPDMVLPNILGTFFYRKTFNWDENNQKTMIHFSGVQNTVSVWINDIYIGEHQGYSTPFSISIPSGILKTGENEIVMSVSNFQQEGFGGLLVSGLTNRAANLCTGGICGDVELRTTKGSIQDISILVSEDCNTVSVEVESDEATTFHWSVYDGENVIMQGDANGGFSFDAKDLERWSPENPKLYSLVFSCPEDKLERIFAVRRLLPDDNRFLLNGNPYYLRGICEHCYFPETLHPHHDINEYKKIIQCIKNLGFNFIRFHTYIPAEEYMQAADELGILLHVESPNNTPLSQWEEITKFCRRHPSVVIYCTGNEQQITWERMEYLQKCADFVHKNTDALFAPQSAMCGIEYAFGDEDELLLEPLKHHPEKLKAIHSFADHFASYSLGYLSYSSHKADPARIDRWHSVYQKPRVTHEICIDGTFADLRLQERYRGTRVGKTAIFSSVEQHLKEKGVLDKADLYFKNSCLWQQRNRKYCFEQARLCRNIAGYDFLGPIDTHWHTFGYDVGMMNEFYELKPGETVENVLRYNGETVLLQNLGRRRNFVSEETVEFDLLTSHFGYGDITCANLKVQLWQDNHLVDQKNVDISNIPCGRVTELLKVSFAMPSVDVPSALKITAILETEDKTIDNEWDCYLFPKVSIPECKELIVSSGMDKGALCSYLQNGNTVLLLGAEPFPNAPLSTRIALAGRTEGNIATVIKDDTVLKDLPHNGFCGWQFDSLMDEGAIVLLEDDIPVSSVIDTVPTHKNFVKQSALFSFSALSGKVLVCSFRFEQGNPAAEWLKARLIDYANSPDFVPEHTLTEEQLYRWLSVETEELAGNQNFALNPNDKANIRINKN